MLQYAIINKNPWKIEFEIHRGSAANQQKSKAEIVTDIS